MASPPMASIPNLMLAEGTERSKVDARTVATQWLHRLEQQISSTDGFQLDELFLEDSWWRDLLALSWTIKSMHSNEILQHLELARKSSLSNMSIVTEGVLAPALVDMGPFTLIEAAFTFETQLGRGKGFLRLANTGVEEWKAWIIMTSLDELKGHEEMHKRSKGPTWNNLQDEAQFDGLSKSEPHVVVIGAGHAGLSVGARLKQLGVPTLLVDRFHRIGQSWRNRYQNLSLHDPVWENHMPYLRFPETFPTWLPRQTVADWLEHYQSIMKIPVQMNSEMTSATWNAETKKWHVELKSTLDGSTTSLEPNHVVFAAGFHSDTPHVPDFEGMNEFRGPIIPSGHFTTVSEIENYRNKKYIVVGSSSSAHDVAQDIAQAGCPVTMIQRDSNMVYSLNSKVMVVGAPYSKPGITTPESDILANSMPFPVAVTMMVGGTQMIYQMDRQLLDRVGETEFKFLKGDDGRGMLHLILKKGGGHYPDQGSLKLIADGSIQVRQCDNGIERITSRGVLLADGREVEGDAIIMATGYKHADYTVRKIFGDEVADRCGVGISFTDHGELRGMFTSIGHPGLWLTAGSFALSRPGSLTLALQIKATELGLNEEHYKQ